MSEPDRARDSERHRRTTYHRFLDIRTRGSQMLRSKPPPDCQNRLGPLAAAARDPRKPVGGVLREVTRTTPAHGLLDRLEDRGHLVNGPSGMDNPVSVLGHENTKAQSEKSSVPRRASSIESLSHRQVRSADSRVGYVERATTHLPRWRNRVPLRLFGVVVRGIHAESGALSRTRRTLQAPASGFRVPGGWWGRARELLLAAAVAEPPITPANLVNRSG